MEELINALIILSKYNKVNKYNPCHFNLEYLYVDINPNIVSLEDKEKLKEYRFNEIENKGFGYILQ